jgi:hypothetical protein
MESEPESSDVADSDWSGYHIILSWKRYYKGVRCSCVLRYNTM